MDINVRSLIREIQRRPVLWDLAHKEHNNRFLLEKLWADVAGAVNATVREVRQKWKYLRDQHRREVRKITDSASEGIAIYEPTWKYFHLLSFLDSQITPKSEKPLANFLPEAAIKPEFWTTETTFDLYDDHTMHSTMMYGGGGGGGSMEEDGDRSKRRKTQPKNFDFNEDLLAYLVKLEQKKVDLLLAQDEAKKKDQSDDFYFMSSLLPIMKSFSNMQKLRVRNKIIKVIIEELNIEHLTASPEPSTGH